MTQREVDELRRSKRLGQDVGIGRRTTFGRLDVPSEHTLTAWTVKQGLEGLERPFKSGKPFTLTISIDPPHPPMVLPKPYCGMYPANSIPLPATLNDPRQNSPYGRPHAGARKPSA